MGIHHYMRHLAARQLQSANGIDFLKLQLANGVDYKAVNDAQETFVHTFIRSLVQLVEAAKVHPSLKAHQDQAMALLDELLKLEGVDWLLRDSEGKLALHIAAEEKLDEESHSVFIRLLLSKKCGKWNCRVESSGISTFDYLFSDLQREVDTTRVCSRLDGFWKSFTSRSDMDLSRQKSTHAWEHRLLSTAAQFQSSGKPVVNLRLLAVDSLLNNGFAYDSYRKEMSEGVGGMLTVHRLIEDLSDPYDVELLRKLLHVRWDYTGQKLDCSVPISFDMEHHAGGWIFDWEQLTGKKESVLHLAAKSTKLRDPGELLDLLLSSGRCSRRVNSPDGSKHTPLYYAIQSRQLASVKVLLAGGADVNGYCETKLPGMNGYSRLCQTPLHVAAELGEDQILRTLLQNDADINAVQKPGGASALVVAAEKLDEETQRQYLTVISSLLKSAQIRGSTTAGRADASADGVIDQSHRAFLYNLYDKVDDDISFCRSLLADNMDIFQGIIGLLVENCTGNISILMGQAGGTENIFRRLAKTVIESFTAGPKYQQESTVALVFLESLLASNLEHRKFDVDMLERDAPEGRSTLAALLSFIMCNSTYRYEPDAMWKTSHLQCIRLLLKQCESKTIWSKSCLLEEPLGGGCGQSQELKLTPLDYLRRVMLPYISGEVGDKFKVLGHLESIAKLLEGEETCRPGKAT
ncbi:ankyrin [Ascobolus immersus RN42]|uniref:Ankyrin n=1 Tax=Ascobolus immersus RN42 TaxID=1160509 RepID=A0A3N4I8P5_ASCIM|nr:ankyrin [Ascobolus immersus RN42]